MTELSNFGTDIQISARQFGWRRFLRSNTLEQHYWDLETCIERYFPSKTLQNVMTNYAAHHCTAQLNRYKDRASLSQAIVRTD